MARKYDIIDRLRAKNEKPYIVLDADHTYTIDTEKTNVLRIMALVSDIDQNEPAKQIEVMDKIIAIALGKEANTYIDSLHLTINATAEIVKSITAGISDMGLDEVENIQKK